MSTFGQSAVLIPCMSGCHGSWELAGHGTRMWCGAQCRTTLHNMQVTCRPGSLLARRGSPLAAAREGGGCYSGLEADCLTDGGPTSYHGFAQPPLPPQRYVCQCRYVELPVTTWSCCLAVVNDACISRSPHKMTYTPMGC